MKEVTFHLEVFDGPLDLLLHLLAKNKVEIKDIPIATILDQYLEYIRQMEEFDLEVASDFIAMAAQLMYIKSKMLLPVYEEEQQEDPRASLVEALLEYQRIREAGSALQLRAQIGRDLFVKGQEQLEKEKREYVFSYQADVLTEALRDMLQRAQRKLPPPVTAFQGIVGHETVPVEEKLRWIVQRFLKEQRLSFQSLLMESQSRSEIVAVFLAVLELSKARKILLEETEAGDCVLSLAAPEDLDRSDEGENHDRNE